VTDNPTDKKLNVFGMLIEDIEHFLSLSKHLQISRIVSLQGVDENFGETGLPQFKTP